MALAKEGLGQIKEVVKEVIEPMGVEIKKEIEELAIMAKQGFDKVDEQLKEIKNNAEDLDKSNNQAHEDAGLRLNSMAYRFELIELKKRVDVLEGKATHHN